MLLAVQLMLAGALAVIGARIIISARLDFIEFVVPEPEAPYTDDENTFKASLGANAPDEGGSMLLLDRVEKLLAEYQASSDALEAKANTILGFLGAGVGVLAVVSGENVAHLNTTPLLLVGEPS